MLSTEELFKKYYTRLCHFAWQLLDDKTMAEDMVQDVFVTLWNSKHLLADNEIAVKNFLYSAVRHACYNHVRHAKIEKRYFDNYQGSDSEQPEVITKIIRSEVMVEIYKVLEKLPPACKQVFCLGYLEGLSNPQIAEELNISVNTVKTQKQRGLKVLKENLDPELLLLLLILFTGSL